MSISPPGRVFEQSMDLGVWSSRVKDKGGVLEIMMNPGISFRKQVKQFQRWIKKQGYQLVSKKALQAKPPAQLLLEYERQDEAVQFKLIQSIAAQVAIVIDDLGYSQQSLSWVYEVDRPLTLAILPKLEYSKILSHELHEKGYEILLHLPMENIAGFNAGPGALEVQMGDEEIRRLIDEDLKDVPYAVGVNNHMGSKATQDERIMTIVLEELSRKGLFFLDSLTSPSVSMDLAQEKGWKIHFRDVFLDHDYQAESIQQQLEELKEQALRRGNAIGIGHFKKATLQAILKAIHEYDDLGIEIVPLSTLYRDNSASPSNQIKEQSA